MGSALYGRRDGKPLVEHCLTFDVAQRMRLRTIGGIMTDHRVLYSFTDGQAIGMVHFRFDLRNAAVVRLVPAFGVADCAGKPRSMPQGNRLGSTVPNFGGRRV